MTLICRILQEKYEDGFYSSKKSINNTFPGEPLPIFFSIIMSDPAKDSIKEFNDGTGDSMLIFFLDNVLL